MNQISKPTEEQWREFIKEEIIVQKTTAEEFNSTLVCGSEEENERIMEIFREEYIEQQRQELTGRLFSKQINNIYKEFYQGDHEVQSKIILDLEQYAETLKTNNYQTDTKVKQR